MSDWGEVSYWTLLLGSPIDTSEEQQKRASQRIMFRVFFRSSFLSEFPLYFLAFYVEEEKAFVLDW